MTLWRTMQELLLLFIGCLSLRSNDQISGGVRKNMFVKMIFEDSAMKFARITFQATPRRGTLEKEAKISCVKFIADFC